MSAARNNAETRRILLVDDEEALVWSLSNRLVKLRPLYVVESANDGYAAMKSLEAGPVDLLVTDVRMPGMSGFELVMNARMQVPGLLVIVMSAYPTTDVRRELGSDSAIEYIQKPFELERFLSVVDAILERGKDGFSGAI